MYTICPFHEVVDTHYPHSDGNLELQNQRMHVAELTLRNGGMEQ